MAQLTDTGNCTCETRSSIHHFTSSVFTISHYHNSSFIHHLILFFSKTLPPRSDCRRRRYYFFGWRRVHLNFPEMAEPTISKSSPEDHDNELKENIEKKKDSTANPEFFSCMLQPSPANSDPNYIAIRRFLLHRKAESGVLRRKVHLFHAFSLILESWLYLTATSLWAWSDFTTNGYILIVRIYIFMRIFASFFVFRKKYYVYLIASIHLFSLS